MFTKEQQVSSTTRPPTTEAATGADSKDPVRSSMPQQNKKQPGHQPEIWRTPARELAKGVGKARELQTRAQGSQSVFLQPDQVLQATSKERWTPSLLEARTMRKDSLAFSHGRKFVILKTDWNASMTPTRHEPRQLFPVVQDKCAHNTASDKADNEALPAPKAHPRMNCDSEANVSVSQIMVETVDVASFHTRGTRAESHRQNVVVPIRQFQDDIVKVIQLIHKNAFRSASISQPFRSFARVRALVAVSRTA